MAERTSPPSSMLNAECHKTDRLLVVDGVLAGHTGEIGCTSVLSRRCTSIVPAEVVFGSVSRYFPFTTLIHAPTVLSVREMELARRYHLNM